MTAPAPPKRQPIPFGKYLLLDRINIGGMAEVWRGKMFGAGGFERLVAIKRILPNIAEDEEFIVMFLDEAKITVQLTHANIAQVYDLDKVQTSYYIAMEYVPGKDMRAIFDRCRKKGEPAPVPLTCYVVAKMCEGLDYAHRKKDQMGRDMNIVHRDISPQNVLISYEGEVKVIDFGIAKAAGKASKTQAGILKGKFAYMSPEQIRGLPLDRRSDVFAVGVCLYEMLTGERLFVGDSDFSVLEKVRKAEVLPPSTYNRRIPEALEKIVLKALAKDVEDRYQYCSDLADDLQRFLITSDSIFSRKDLMQYMKSTFAEDVEREKLRLQDYASVKPSEGMIAALEMGLAGAPPLINTGVGPPQPAPIPLTAPQASAQPPQAPARPPTTNVPVIAPPTLQPVQPAVPVLDKTDVPRRSPSLSAIPRLTAAAPLLGNTAPVAHASSLLDDDDEEGGATVMMDGSEVFNALHGDPAPADTGGAITPAITAQPPVNTFKPDNSSTAVVGPPASSAATPTPPVPQPAAAAPQKRPSRSSQPSLGRATPPPPPTPDLEDDRDEDESTVSTSPARPSFKAAAPKPVPAPSSKKLAVIGAAVAALLLMVAGVALVLFKPGPTGFLYVDLPKELEGRARVNVNGEDIANPKAMFPVQAGPAAVMITADGWKTFAQTVEVKEGKQITTLNPKLQKEHRVAQLALAFSPEEAEVVINGKVVKKEGERAGPYLGELAVGEQSVIELRLAGHKPWTQKVTPASETEPVRYNARLEQDGVQLKVESEPEGAAIIVAGRELAVTPATVTIPAGSTELTLSKRCFDDEKLSIKPASGGAAASLMTAKLKKQRNCR